MECEVPIVQSTISTLQQSSPDIFGRGILLLQVEHYRNERRERLLDFCNPYILIASNTMFKVPTKEKMLHVNFQKEDKLLSNRLYFSKIKL